jgi:hypothetical protein
METLSQIRQNAVDEMVENEALTADLDDIGAKALLEWGTFLIDQVVVDQHLDKLDVYLNAVKQFLRLVNRWAAHGILLDGVLDPSWLNNFNQQLSVLYDGMVRPVNTVSLQSILSKGGHDGIDETIPVLRNYVEELKQAR